MKEKRFSFIADPQERKAESRPTFGTLPFAQHTSQRFAKVKEPKYPPQIELTMRKIESYLIIVLLILSTSSCVKEEQVNILQNNGANTYVFDDLIGNVRITIYNTPSNYDITVINGPGSVIGCAIRNYSSPSTIYFSDSYIPKGNSETQSSSSNGIPTGQKLELKLVLYKSTVSSAIYRLIEALGLDFWDGINEYKESIADEYVSVFILSE